MSLVGYIAIDQYGQVERLLKPRHPRKQLMEKCFTQHVSKMYTDLKGGGCRHIGYVVRGRWFRIHEVHEWKGGKHE